MQDFAVIVDAFAAFVAFDASQRMTGLVSVGQSDFDSLPGEQVLVWQSFVSFQLLLFLGRQMTEKLLGQFARSFDGDDADGFVGFCVEERRGQLAEVSKLQGSFAQPATGDGVDGVSGTAINFDKDDQPLADLWLFDANQTTTQHRHPHAQNLTRAHVAVIAFGFYQVFGKSQH